MAATGHSDRRDRGAVVLVYHRIGPSGSDPLGLNVTPEHLAEHVGVLGSGRYQPVPLTQLAHALHQDAVPPDAIAVTFDDGYSGVLTEAKPLLEKNGVPATAFVPSGLVGDGREFWWEELDDLIPGSTNGRPSPRRGIVRATRLTARVLRRRENRTRRYREHFLRLRVLEPAERRAALDELAADLPARRSPRPTSLPLSSGELRALAAGDLVAVGAHTVTHPVLESLSPSAQEQEIAGSKAELEQMLDRPVRSFAYPYGGPTEYGGPAVTAVRRAGFDLACANVPGLVRPGTDVFQIPRFIVPDWDGDTFGRALEHWVSGRGLEPRGRRARKATP